MSQSGRIEASKPVEAVAEPLQHKLYELFISQRLAAMTRRIRNSWRLLIIYVPYVWLFMFFLVPFFFVLKISLAEAIIARPPFSNLIEWVDETAIQINVTFGNFLFLLEDDLYWITYLNSLKLATISTVLCLLLGYPMAYAIARASSTLRSILLLMVILPFWTSFLLRVYAWIGILGNNGLINNLLMWLGFIDTPIQILYSDVAIYIGIVYSYLPFMILPLYANLERLDLTLNEAAADLGAQPWVVFVTVTLPLSVPGIIAGALLVFIPATGEYVIPALLGGPDSLMIGRVLFDEFFINRDWPIASAVAIALLVLLVVPIVLFQHYQMKEAEAGS